MAKLTTICGMLKKCVFWQILQLFNTKSNLVKKPYFKKSKTSNSGNIEDFYYNIKMILYGITKNIS